MGKIPDNFEKVIKFLAHKLKDKQYSFRGTASLVIQGLDMNIDDIDILCNKNTALLSNELLKNYLTEKVEYKESKSFKSYFGRFKIEKVLVEIMGNWQIKKIQSWSEVFDASDDEIKTIEFAGRKLRVTRIETELKTFALMGRWSAYQKIKRQL